MAVCKRLELEPPSAEIEPGAGRGQGGGVVLVRVQADVRPALGGLAAVLGALGVSGDDRAADRGVQLSVGEVPGARDDPVLDGTGGGVGKGGGGLGDDLGPVGVDAALGQGGTGPGEPPPQRDREAGPGFGPVRDRTSSKETWAAASSVT